MRWDDGAAVYRHGWGCWSTSTERWPLSRRLAEHYDTFILSTGSWHNPSTRSGKLLWVREHLPEVARKRLILSHRKDLLSGDYLIDDRTRNGAAEFVGEHIHFGSDKFPDWDAVLGYLLPGGEARGN